MLTTSRIKIPSTLNQAQSLAFKTVVEDRENLALSSKAGCGKSFVIKEIFAAMEDLGYTTLRCAFSGRAAAAIEGVTTHRESAIGTGASMTLPLGVPPEPKMWQGVKRKTAASCVANVDSRWLEPLLVCGIDEVYQLSSEDARLWYDIGMLARSQSKKPLAPPIFLVSGDIGQFLPIEGNLIFEPAEFSFFNQRGLVERMTLPSIFEDIKFKRVHLTENMRQHDPAFQKALDWLYLGIAVHPCILDRVVTPEVSTVNGEVVPIATYYFNNILVTNENAKQLEAFANKESKVYKGLGETLTSAEVKSLLPITEQMRVYLGAPFTVTSNIVVGNKLVASNGEVVTTTALSRNSLNVVKADGTKIELPYTAQYLPVNHHSGKRKLYQTLPGYPGSACSIMKVQGETINVPVKFAVWQLVKGQIRSLKNYAGALYTITSRVTDLKLLHFDRSLGIEGCQQLLKQSLNVHPKVLNYILEGRPPLWATDTFKQEFVIEFNSEFNAPGLLSDYKYFSYSHTSLTTGVETIIISAFKVISIHGSSRLQYITSGKLQDPQTIVGNFDNYGDILETLATRYQEHYIK